MTFSLVACDLEARQWGVVVASKFLAVGAVVPWAQAEVGAIATPASANVSYGPRGLQLLATGASAQQTIDRLAGLRKGKGVVGQRALGIKHDQRQIGFASRGIFGERRDVARIGAGHCREHGDRLHPVDGVSDLVPADLDDGKQLGGIQGRRQRGPCGSGNKEKRALLGHPGTRNTNSRGSRS